VRSRCDGRAPVPTPSPTCALAPAEPPSPPWGTSAALRAGVARWRSRRQPGAEPPARARFPPWAGWGSVIGACSCRCSCPIHPYMPLRFHAHITGTPPVRGATTAAEPGAVDGMNESQLRYFAVHHAASSARPPHGPWAAPCTNCGPSCGCTAGTTPHAACWPHPRAIRDRCDCARCCSSVPILR
jgi:hypothetical protein